MKLGINPRDIATRWSQNWPAGLRRALGPTGDWLDMMLADHGVLRAAYLNLHQISPLMWRSAQPSPRAIRRLAGHGIKTIVNLRGARDCGSYVLEAQACQRHGIALIDCPIDSRYAPSAERVLRAADIFETIAYPALMHCKSGADRVGLMAALYLFLHEGRPLHESARQLSLRYGHVRQARTGVLDHFLKAYEIDRAKTGRTLLEWVASKDYDPREMTNHFRTNVMANVVVDFILQRE